MVQALRVISKEEKMGKFKISVRTVVAIGIGAALFFVLNRFAGVPTGIPNVNLFFGVAILAVFSTIFGPIAGFLIGFIGHTLVDLTFGWGIWWSWVISSGLLGLLIGACARFYKLEDGGFDVKRAVKFNLVQILANAIIWGAIAPTLDILIYSEPANKVYLQGLVAGATNAVIVLVLGTLLFFGYSKTLAKPGSLKKE
jgi:energy-coupling factor transport system substrate-specific component